MFNHALAAVNAYFTANTSVSARSAVGFKEYCDSSSDYSDVFVCDGYRLCRAAKLLMALGYGNFSVVVQYDIYAMAEAYVSSGASWNQTTFSKKSCRGYVKNYWINTFVFCCTCFPESRSLTEAETV